VRGIAVSETEEGHLLRVLASQVVPHLDVDIVTTSAAVAGAPRCFVVVVERSARGPHAVTPNSDRDALKYPIEEI